MPVKWLERLFELFCMLIFFKTNEEIEGEKCSERGSHQKRKNSFTCRSAEKEQSQPQLYGTSYFLVRNTPRPLTRIQIRETRCSRRSMP